MRKSATTVVYPAGGLSAALEDCRAAGLDGIELQGHHVAWLLADASRQRAFQAELVASGLSVSAVMLGYLRSEQEYQAHLRGVAFAQEVGCRVVPVMAHRRGEGSLGDFLLLASRLTEASAEHRVSIAVHHHLGTIVNTPAQVDQLLAATEGWSGLGLLLDTAHLALHGTDIQREVLRWRDRIAHVHVKDLVSAGAVNPVTAGPRAAQHLFRTPGDGVLDFSTIVPPLSGSRLNPWLSIEIETFHRSPLDSLTVATSTIEGVLK